MTMCGRYVFDDETEALEDRFGVKVHARPRANYNVAPGQVMPVIRANERGVDGAVVDMMKWGLIPSWSKDPKIGYKLINARSETVFDKPAWRNAIKTRRCIIPANGFYEWKRDGSTKKQPYFITVNNKKMIGFAGLWESWKAGDGEEIHSYSILTTTPNKEMSAIHDRMPVILHTDDEALWLSENDHEYIEQVLSPYEDNALSMIKVSTDVNAVRNNDGHLILPMNSN